MVILKIGEWKNLKQYKMIFIITNMKNILHVLVFLLSSYSIYNLINNNLSNFIIVLYFKKQFFAFFISIIISLFIYFYI
jgi:hypothetical protein